MAKIVKVYKEEMPAVVLAGKVYHNDDRDEHGTFAGKWAQWFASGWFDRLKAAGHPHGEDAFVGAMRWHEGAFEYWIGVLMDSVDELPASFSSVQIPAGSVGVAWIKGRDDAALYAMHEACMEAFRQAGFVVAGDAWYIERYVCPRFTRPDENNEVILDYLVSL